MTVDVTRWRTLQSFASATQAQRLARVSLTNWNGVGSRHGRDAAHAAQPGGLTQVSGTQTAADGFHVWSAVDEQLMAME